MTERRRVLVVTHTRREQALDAAAQVVASLSAAGLTAVMAPNELRENIAVAETARMSLPQSSNLAWTAPTQT
jgi:hypothetical protein